MSNKDQDQLLQQQLQELIRVGVGGKFKETSDYVSKIQEELEFEEAMQRGGIERYRKQNNDAVAKRQESTTLYGIVWQQKYISKVSELINDDVKTLVGGDAGRRQIALKLICQCLPKRAFDKGVFLDNRPDVWDICSLIILKNVIDGISNQMTLNKLAIIVGTALMTEAKITSFKDREKDKFNQISKRLSGRNIPQNKNRYAYKHKVWTYCMNKHNLDFDNWSKDDRLHLGVKCLEYLERLGLIRKQNRKVQKTKTVSFIEATPKIIEEIKNFNIHNETLFPKYLPMIMPPRDWDMNPFVGGYYGKRFNSENSAEEIATTLKNKKE
jgi:DNA-directed RNA polymerase